MTTKTTLRHFLAIAGSLLMAVSSALAQSTLYWDGGTVDIGADGNGASGGGAGTWNTTIKNWDAGAAPHVSWNNANNDTAVFAGTAGTVTIGAPVTAGGLTFNTANYVLTGGTLTLAGSATINNGVTATNSCSIAGSSGLLKTGAGSLTLTGVNSFSGGIFINGGILNLPSGATSANLGDSGNLVTFTGNGTIYFTSNTTLSQGFAINAGVAGTFHSYKMTATINNSLAGSGTLNAQGQGDGSGSFFIFTSTNNTFSGDIVIYNSSGGAYLATLTMNSLDDTPGRRIRMGNNGNSTAIFTYGTDAVVPLVLSNRQIELYASSGILNNNATNVNCTVTVNTDLMVSGNANRPFTLGGGNIGNNTFAGAITNRTGYVTSLTKANAGKWILTGANTYSGTTTISDGTLEFASRGTYAGNITVTDTTPSPLTFSGSYTQTVSGVISGSMQLIKEGSGTLSLTGANTHTGTVVNAGTLSLGNGTSSSSLYDLSTLSVASGAKVNLNYTGSDAVLYLNLGGSPAAKGTWGATGSGAANISDTYFTGTGVIDNLSGDTTGINTTFWDGGTSDIGTDGNAVSAGGNGTWDTTLKNWDYGFVPHKAWANTTAEKAVFAGSENADRTVTVNGSINIKELSFETTGTSGTRYKIDGGTLNFGSDGMIRTANNQYDQTITSAITGSPEVRTKDFGGNTYKGLKFAPATGTVTLGAILNPDNTGNQDKAGVTLAGSTTGNIAASIDYAGTDRYADTIVQSGEWTVSGGIRTGTLKLYGGKLIVGGTVVCDNNAFSFTNGTLAGTAIVNEPVTVPASGTLAPGNPTGTMTVTNNNCAINGKLAITINGEQVSKLAIAPAQTLTITGATLEVNVLAAPSGPVTIATYGSGKLTGTFASNNLPAGWTIDYGATAIVLTPRPSGAVLIVE